MVKKRGLGMHLAIGWILAAVMIAIAFGASARAQDQVPVAKEEADAVVGGYYGNAAGKSGGALRAALNGIIAAHRRLSYEEAWPALEYTDEDPTNPNNVLLLYTGRSQPKSRRVRGGNDQDAWNREHVWPRSHGFPSREQIAHNDIHNLRPSDVSVNADRGNKDFDIGGAPIAEAAGAHTDDDSFEAPDPVKGDVARMVFYMAVRYEGDEGVPDLRLVNAATGPGDPALGHVCTLMEWHALDPVGDDERRRHARIVERQGNRNPFIDHPEWVADIWGEACD